MAKVNGIIQLSGTVDGVCFYTLNGKSYVRAKSTLNAKRVKTAPEFKRSRETAKEFGWMAKIGKTIRSYLIDLKPFMDKSMYFRLHTLLHKIVQQGTGVRGKRLLDLGVNGHVLEGFSFIKQQKLNRLIALDLNINNDRTKATLTHMLHNDEIKHYISDGATHYKIVLHILCLSQFSFNNNTERYEAVTPDNVGITAVTFSDYNLIGGEQFNNPLEAFLGNGIELTAANCLMVSVGVVFAELVNGTFNELQQGKCMEIVGVY